MPKHQTYWLIWSFEHQAWWMPRQSGYTTYRESAGIYLFDEAFTIVKEANQFMKNLPNEAMVPHVV